MALLDTFIPREYYHVFSRTNNKEMMFRSTENRRYFLDRIRIYLQPYLHIHAYALLGNHYHLLVELKTKEELINTIREVEEEKRTKAMARVLNEEEDTCLVSKTSQVSSSSRNIDDFIIHQLQRLGISYTKSINKQIGRQGHLFNRPFKRNMIDFESKYKYMMYYIHHNARKHGFVSDFREYGHHSYFEIINEDSTLVNHEKVFTNFGSKERFIDFHLESHYEELFEGLVIEQDW